MIFKIYIGISILTMIMFWLYIWIATKRATRRHGKQLFSRCDSKGGFADLILVAIKIAVVSFCPIIHIGCFGVLIFAGDNLNTTIDKRVARMSGRNTE